MSRAASTVVERAQRQLSPLTLLVTRCPLSLAIWQDPRQGSYPERQPTEGAVPYTAEREGAGMEREPGFSAGPASMQEAFFA